MDHIFNQKDFDKKNKSYKEYILNNDKRLCINNKFYILYDKLYLQIIKKR